jgi:hypothetical protein
MRIANRKASAKQRRFVFGALACPVCPYGVSGRCEGEIAATSESFLSDGPSIGCLQPSRQRIFYRDLHGRGDPPRQRSRHSQIHLPSFIPQTFSGLRSIPNFPNNLLLGVSLTNILDGEGRVRYKSGGTLRRALNLRADARLALIGTAIDYTIERFWEGSDSRDAWKRLSDLEFEFSTSFSYSVWDHQARFDQIFNQEKNFASHDLLLAHGIPSIPFLFFYNERDYAEIVSWLKERSDVTKIAMLLQFQRSRSGFHQQLRNMHRMQDDLGREFRFLVVGPCSLSKISKILTDFRRITIVTGQPIFKAREGERTLEDLSHIKADRNIPVAQLAVHNVERYLRFFSNRRLKKSTADQQKSIMFLSAR